MSKPTGSEIRNDGAIPYASQIPNDSDVSGDYLDSALNVLSGMGSLSYRGTWNAATNVPALASSVGTKGYYYVVSSPGATNLNGVTDWAVGDWAIFNGTAWEKADHTDQVASVFRALWRQRRVTTTHRKWTTIRLFQELSFLMRLTP